MGSNAPGVAVGAFLAVNKHNMASPQVENGHTRIANELFDEIYNLKINIDSMRILLFILRKTYGWGKKRDKIALSQFETCLNMRRQHVCRNLNKLFTMKIILRIQDDNGNEYEINKNYEEWEVVPKQGRPQIGNKVVPKQVMNPVPKQGHTKETITKEKQKACVLKNSKGEDLSSMKASDYSPDGWSPLDRKKMLRALSRSLGEKKTSEWSQLLFGSAWDFRKAFLHFQGYEYPDNILLDEVSKTLAKWYELGETRDSIRDMMTEFFKGNKAKTVTITPNSVFSSHTYNSWKQNKL